jgi:hypothetical protein
LHPGQRWPKGPFPEKYRFATAEPRLIGAWDDARRAAVPAILAGLGLALDEAYEDPYLRRYVGEGAIDLPAVRAALAGCEVIAFRHRDALGVVATGDPIDAVIAVGVAGPEEGTGLPTVVRFLLMLRGFARWDIEALEDDRIAMVIAPKSAEHALRIAERVLEICGPLARSGADAQTLARRMIDSARLEISWR